MRIDNCYDSHIHWRATGDFAERMNLKALKSPDEIFKINVPIGTPWILGYNWSFSRELISYCTRELLDQWCADQPVALSMSDGHSLWVNTKALSEAGLMTECPFPEELCPRDAQGKPRGILKEEARNFILKSIPAPSMAVMTRQLLKAQKIFHEEGITHIRDVHMTEKQWQVASHLADSGLLKLAVEAFIFDESLNHLEQIQLAKKCKDDSVSLLKMKGIKIFIDGSLGSETAALSQKYASGSGYGHLQFSDNEIEKIIINAWSEGLEVAFHCIGDEASHKVACAARAVQAEGFNGKIHFEHVQILRDETIELMKQLDCICHLQPGHWLDDKGWLAKRIGEDLFKKVFPWRRLQEAEVPFFFGSDSPLSRPGVVRIQEAIEDASEHGLSRLLGGIETYVSHPDRSWPPNTFSEFNDQKVDSVTFSSELL